MNGRSGDSGAPLRLAFFPQWHGNPYLRLLHGHLVHHGIEAVEGGRFELDWLWRERRLIDVLHFHWPQPFYVYRRGPETLRPLLSWVRLGFFAGRLLAARALGYRLVWTVHQVYPHEPSARGLDRAAARLLGRLSHVLLAHDQATAEHARAELGGAGGRIAVVPHGSYVGVYPPGRPRHAVRAELGIASEAFALLCFGSLRAYKDVELLLEAFAGSRAPGLTLLVAGAARDRRVVDAVNAAAESDPRIKPLLGYVAEDRVAELFEASDAAVVARGNGGTSGSLVLALSLGVPVIAADKQPYVDLLDGGRAGWLFRAGDPKSLRAAIERAAEDPGPRRAKAQAALESSRRLRWPDIAGQVAFHIRGKGGDSE